MKTLRNRLLSMILTASGILLLGAVFISCGKSDTGKVDNNSTETEKQEMTEVKEDTYSESESDLANVDYSIFYDELAPHGEWVQVNIDEIKNAPSAGNISSPGPRREAASILNMLTGTKPAYADENVQAGVAFVWRPAAAVNDVTWQPYTRGEWLYTEDHGWYFNTAPAEPVGVTYHYGRWWNSPSLGWVWLPGKAWSPAWVTWRESNDAVAWAPIPPSVYIVNNSLLVNDMDDDVYVVVDKRDFVRPEIYKYMYKENKNKIMIKEMRKLDGPMVVNRTIINKGPEVSVIESAGGNKVVIHKIKKVKNRGDVTVSNGSIAVFTPMLKESITNNGTLVSMPQNFVSSKNVKKKNVEMSNDGNYRKGVDVGPDNTKIKLGDRNNNSNDRRGKGNDDNKFDDSKRKGRGNDDINKQRSGDDNGKHKNRGGRDNSNKNDRKDDNKNRGGDNDRGKGNDKKGKK